MENLLSLSLINSEIYNCLQVIKFASTALYFSLKKQVKKLQSELTNIKNRESQLSLKIQALTTQQEKVNEEIKSISLWTKIRTPFLIFSGIGTIFVAYKWLRNKWENSS